MKTLILILAVFTWPCYGYAQQSAAPIKLGTFNSLPKTLEYEYCNGLFIYDSIPVSKRKYVFVTNIEKFAIVKINGKEVQLKLISSSQPSTKTFKRVFGGDGYRATLITSEVRQHRAISLEAGTLEITRNKQRIKIKVHGEASCS